MGKDNHILAKPVSQSQASLRPKGNISIPLLIEQISNQNMYPEIIEAMQCQQITLPSAFLMLGMNPAHRRDRECGQCRHIRPHGGHRGSVPLRVLKSALEDSFQAGRGPSQTLPGRDD